MKPEYSAIADSTPFPFMSPSSKSSDGEYVLATGAAAVRRLFMLHNIYSPAGRRILLQAGLTPGMRVADFGCGIGATTGMLAEMVGPSGSVTGIDANVAQLEQAKEICKRRGWTNASFQEADACATGLPRASFDLVYCRFLLLHLTDPASCLREMRDILKPGGLLVVEDGDIASAGSAPSTALDAGVDLFIRLGRTRGLDYSLARNLYHMVKDAGFPDPQIEIHQPAFARGENRLFLKWSIEEAGPALISEKLVTSDQFQQILASIQEVTENPDVLILAPRMSLVWARKPLQTQSFDKVA
ncbi:MAG: class I SAM-dependent methyltransferase [Acidobacteriaceae bacterium]|nr:class I SAM-dependent methyltransferase [Acidobacteriaceae bacterium]